MKKLIEWFMKIIPHLCCKCGKIVRGTHTYYYNRVEQGRYACDSCLVEHYGIVCNICNKKRDEFSFDPITQGDWKGMAVCNWCIEDSQNAYLKELEAQRRAEDEADDLRWADLDDGGLYY